MQKLLFVSDVIPDLDGTGSEQRAYSFLSAYSKICDVELWCQPRADYPNARRLSKISDLVSEIFVYYPAVMSVNRTIRGRFMESLRQAHAVHLIKLPLELKHDRIIWDIDELPPEFRVSSLPVISDSFHEELHPLARKWVDFSKTCRFVACSSQVELSPHMPNAVIVPNCYNLRHDSNGHGCRTKSKTILFVGHLGYPPNVEAVDFFIKEVFPKLPDTFTFRIVGKKPTGRIHQGLLDALSAHPRVEVLFDVPTCTPYYQDAFVAVVPLLQGTGTRFKILEAFAHRCPVISTSKGCEGHSVSHGKELLIYDTADAIASACRRLQDDQNLAESLVRAGLEFVTERNSQEALERALFEQIDRFVPSLLGKEEEKLWI